MKIETKLVMSGGLFWLLTLLTVFALWVGDSAVASAASCPMLNYHSAPSLHAQRACESAGIRTQATQPGTYLFLTPGGSTGAGAGIFKDNGELVWWQGNGGVNDEDLTVVHYDGQPYLALWGGSVSSTGSYGVGSVTLYDEHYQVAGHITATTAYGAHGIDLHEFQITPQGDALIGSYTPRRMYVNGHYETVLGYLVEKLSLVKDSTGIHTGKVLFAWNALNDVRLSDSHMSAPGANGVWDYFHGNGITQAPDGNLLVSGRNTWGIYEINDRRGTRGFDHIYWQVGAKQDRRLVHPWCYQHNIAALGHGEYSLYDNGGTGPGCQGSSQHPARGLEIWVDTSHRPVGVTWVRGYHHNPPIYTAFTGSNQVLGNGDRLIDWANVPEITEYAFGGQPRMDLSLSNWSYRGFRFAWNGQPTTKPATAAQYQGSGTGVWASWNGSTQVTEWQILGGADASHLSPVGSPKPKGGFESGMWIAGHYATIEVQALDSNGHLLATSDPVTPTG